MKNYLEHTEHDNLMRIGMSCLLNKGMSMAHIISNVNDIKDIDDLIPETMGKIKQCQRTNIINSSSNDIFTLTEYQRVGAWLDKLLMTRSGIDYIVVWKDMSWPLSEHFEFLVNKVIERNPDFLAAGWMVGDDDWEPNHPIVINLDVLRRELDSEANEGNLFHFRELFDHEKGNWLSALFLIAKYFDLEIEEFDNEIADEIMVFDSEYERPDILFFDKMMSMTDIVDTDISEDDIHNLRSNADDMDEFYQNFYELKLLKFQLMYVTNTEFVPSSLIFKNKYNTLIMPCSGLNQILKFIEHRESVERIVHFDFSPISVRWTKHVIENWNGENFEEWYEENKHVILSDGIMREENIIYEKEQLESMENLLKQHKVDIKEVMEDIRKVKNDFLLVDVSKEPMKFAEVIGDDENKNVYMNITNIFQYESTYLNNDPLDAQIAFLNIMKSLSTNGNRLYLTGDTPGGVNYSEELINSKICIF